MTGMNQSAEPLNPPNTTEEPTRRRKLTRERKERDYPNLLLRVKNPLAKGHSRGALNLRGSVLEKLGVVEADIANVPRIVPRIKEVVGTVPEAVSIIEGDDNPDSLKFMAKWNSLTARERREVRLEHIITAAGLTTRRFMELLAGATYDHGEMMANFYKSQHKLKVLKSTVKAATDEVPILDKDGEAIGVTNGSVKAQELFFKLTGDIKPSGGVVVNSNNQTANITQPPAERQPLQSMDSWLLEIDDVRKPKQLQAPVIPVEMPDHVPDIEYLDVLGE
jgi:hypothetical protein